MRRIFTAVAALGILMLAVPPAPAQSKSSKDDEQGSLIIIFKDGRRQSFRLSGIDRVEFSSQARRVAAASPARFLGSWKVGDGTGGTFIITLKPDGVAHKTLGQGGGKWEVIDGEARVSWDDGWHDVIRKVGNKYEKVAYSPGKSFADEPSNVGDAEYTEPH